MKLHYPLNPVTGIEDQTQLPWSDGVPQTGQEGSYPPSAAVVEPMTELANLIAQAGITGTSSDLFQLTRAIRGGQLDFDATDTGTADAVICQVGLAHTAIVAGLPFTFIKGPAANTGNAVPTLTITDLAGNNALTGTIVKAGGGALKAGDLPANALITVRARAAGVFSVVSLVTLSDTQSNAQTALQSATAFYGTDTGVANALAVTLSPVPAAYGPTGIQLLFVKVAANNTGASTINVNGLGTKAVTNDVSGGALQGGELLAGKIVLVVYDGTSFRLLTAQQPAFGGGSFGSGGSLVSGAVTSWTVPAGVTRVRVRCYGGGGGGGGAAVAGAAAAGGGGGGYAEGIFNVTPAQVITVIAGSGGGGAAGGTSNTGGSGSMSSFGSYCSATGGAGGLGSGSGAQGTGSAGGAGSNGNTLNIVGTVGSAGGAISGTVGLSGAGGSSFNANGGGPSVGGGTNGGSLGGGGSGGANGGGGGNGGLGLVVLEFIG